MNKYVVVATEPHPCDLAKGCTSTANAAACDDGNLCTVKDGCKAGKCSGGRVLDCGDGNFCTTESCGASSGCGYKVTECGDGNTCTADSCDKGKGCVNVSAKAPVSWRSAQKSTWPAKETASKRRKPISSKRSSCFLLVPTPPKLPSACTETCTSPASRSLLGRLRVLSGQAVCTILASAGFARIRREGGSTVTAIVPDGHCILAGAGHAAGRDAVGQHWVNSLRSDAF